MRLTTLNLEGVTEWSKRQPAIIEYLQRIDPDIIFFQEAVFLPELSPFNQAQLLNKSLKYPHEHSAISRLQIGLEYPLFREGLVALSKFPVTKSDVIVLKKAEGDEHNRIIQLLDVVINNKVIGLANVHFSLTDTVDYATAHLQETLDIIKARDEERIIAGDFNMNHLESLSDMWADRYKATTTVPYISFPGMNKRNDYILIPKSDSFGALSVSDDRLSDHRAVTVDITLV